MALYAASRARERVFTNYIRMVLHTSNVILISPSTSYPSILMSNLIWYAAPLALATHLGTQVREPQTAAQGALVFGSVPYLAATLFRLRLSASGFSLLYLEYFVILSLSVIAYRLSPLHPLAGIPGPAITKTSAFAMSWIVYQGKTHIHLSALHKKYGPVVRFGMCAKSCYNKSD